MRIPTAKTILFSLFLSATPLFAQSVLDATLRVDTVVSGLSQPITMAFIGPDDFLVLQKGDGQVRRVIGGVLQAGNVLDVPVNSTNERGLLGITLHPNFVNNRWVYLYYTEASADGGTALGNRIYRYTWNGSALGSPALVADLPVNPGPNHNGGIIDFGPDDNLYAIIGDLNHNGKLQNQAGGPDPDNTGILLRMAPDGSALPSNPFYDAADPLDPMNRVYAYGIRNSFGFTFDRLTGALWETENGPSSYDEINRVFAGMNGGWNAIMGPDSRDPEGVGNLWMTAGASYSDPEFSWAVPVAPTAIAFVASRKLGCGLANDALVGDNNCGQLYHFEPSVDRQSLSFQSSGLQDRVADNGANLCDAELSEVEFGSGFGAVTDLENGPDGRMYVVSLTNGRVYRIARASGTVADDDGDEVADACDCAVTNASAFAPPYEVPRLRLSGTAPNAGWDSQNPQTGSGTSYTVITGDLGALRTSGGFGSACTLASSLASPAYMDPRANPASGQARYYLVRSSNACGNGTFGDGSENPDARDMIDASLPLSCF